MTRREALAVSSRAWLLLLPDPVCTDPALTEPMRAMLCGVTDIVR